MKKCIALARILRMCCPNIIANKDTIMTIICHRSSDTAQARRFESAVLSATPGKTVKISRAMESLQITLAGTCLVDAIVLLYIGHNGELDDLGRLRDHLVDAMLIFVIPETSEKMTKHVHRFYPRYVTTEADGFGDMVVVLKNLIRRIEKRSLQNRPEDADVS